MVLSKERKKLLLTIALVGIAAILIGTGTYAYFSRTISTTTINFTAGTIDFSLNNSNVWDTQYYNDTFYDLKPCQKRWVNVTIKNNGTNPFYLWLNVCNISSHGGYYPASEMYEDPGNVINNIEDVILFDLYHYNSTTGIMTVLTDNNGYVINHTNWSPQNWAIRSIGCQYCAMNLTTGNVAPYYVWQPGEDHSLNMSFMLACNTTNWAQGDYMHFNMTLIAIQSEGWDATGSIPVLSEFSMVQKNFP